MRNRKIIIGFIILIGVGLLVFSQIQQNTNDKDYNNNLLSAQFKKYCRIVEKESFEDLALGIRFSFNSDILVCDYQSPIDESGREIYLWKKQAFEKSEPLGQGAVGKITVNPLPQLPILPEDSVVIKKEELTISGIPTSVKTVQQPKCQNNCSTARIAEITHLGDKFVLEEYTDGVGLMESFEFVKRSN